MKIGFTGTRAGMTSNQKEAIERWVKAQYIEEAHHGDCIGADRDFHNICSRNLIQILIHPCNLSNQRAYTKGYYFSDFPIKPPLDRNRDIVNACDELWACPKETEEVLRSGTWATIRYARKTGKPVRIFYP